MTVIIIFAVLCILFVVWVIIENHIFFVTRYTLASEKAVETFKIAQLSDLHNYSFGKDNAMLINALKREKPDLIVFSGDTIDGPKTNNSLAVVTAAAKIAPTFLTIGNHEASLARDELEKFRAAVETCGAKLLDNEVVPLNLGERSINLIALSDPNYYATTNKTEMLESTISEIAKGLDDASFNLAVTHRPEYFNIYMKYPFDLVLAGHAHGGQWRLFGIGAFATGQGIFPKYSGGAYNMGNKKMIVSRGLGNGKPIPRIFNTPELVIINIAPCENR